MFAVCERKRVGREDVLGCLDDANLSIAMHFKKPKFLKENVNKNNFTANSDGHLPSFQYKS